MKTIVKTIRGTYHSAAAFLLFAIISVQSIAQETVSEKVEKTTVEITNHPENWFANNWLWIVGVVVFLILFFALAGGSSFRRRTTVHNDPVSGRKVTTTTEEDV